MEQTTVIVKVIVNVKHIGLGVRNPFWIQSEENTVERTTEAPQETFEAVGKERSLDGDPG